MAHCHDSYIVLVTTHKGTYTQGWGFGTRSYHIVLIIFLSGLDEVLKV